MPMSNSKQTQTVLNVGLRNAIAQMQIDVVNAGNGFIVPGQPIKPFGLTVNNTAGGGCYDPATFTYGQNCFDELHVISINAGTDVSTPISATSCVSKTSSTLDVLPNDPSVALTTLAGEFQNNDQLLLVTVDNSRDITQMAMIALTADRIVSGGKAHLAHNPTGPLEANSLINQDPNPLNNLQANY